jgi:hypothetical protein
MALADRHEKRYLGPVPRMGCDLNNMSAIAVRRLVIALSYRVESIVFRGIAAPLAD